MADVFISYARADRALAAHLAEDLKSLGYTVWWDTELVASDDFQEVIFSALSAATVAIVIWSGISVKSRFVRDEARYAQHQSKLIAVKTPELDIFAVPLGFQSQHMESVADLRRICAALHKLDVKPSAPRPGQILSAQDIARSEDAESLIAFIAEADDADLRKRAAARIRELAEAVAKGTLGGAAKHRTSQIQAQVKSLTSTRWSAFLSGLLLRVPEFQRHRQGVWTSWGVVTSVTAIVLAIPVAMLFLQAYIQGRSDDFNPRSVPWGLVHALATSVGLFFAHRYSAKFLATKNWLAGSVLAVTSMISTASFAWSVSIVLAGLARIDLEPVFLSLLNLFEVTAIAAFVSNWRASVNAPVVASAATPTIRPVAAPSPTPVAANVAGPRLQPKPLPQPAPVAQIPAPRATPPRPSQPKARPVAAVALAEAPTRPHIVLAGADAAGRPLCICLSPRPGDVAGTWTVGRNAPRLDLDIADNTVSHQHARLRLTPGNGVEVCDLGSTNGTWVDGQRIAKDYVSLESARTVAFGQFEMRVART